MRIQFQPTITAVVLGVALSAISGEAALATRSRDYTPIEFRTVLYNLGYNVPLIDSPLTDERTQQAIREVQRQNKIQVDGIAGSQTQDAVATLVTNLQHTLNVVVNPKPPLPVTQFYGPQTQVVVRQFQEKFSLPVTGQATLEVRNRLEQASKGGPRDHAWVYTPQEFRAVLRGLGYKVEANGNSLTDEQTRQAIRNFQRQYNLVVDGVAGPQTQDFAGDLVRNLQHNLNLVMKPSPLLPRNHFYGLQTEAAVQQFQKLFNLPVTGVASLEVRTQLNQAAKRVNN